ncbi:MAG: hypothetical protein FWE58_00555 [Methanobrevibacter sp.]|nr:hypothetical protein [Methanobrevibacter sp.]
MNIKEVLVLLLFLVVITAIITAIITPTDAKLSCDVGAYSLIGHNVENGVYLNVWTDIGNKSGNPGSSKYFSKRKAELNKVNKIVFTINGYKTITIKKPAKGWKNKDYNPIKNRIMKDFKVKDNLAGKSYSIKLYDKKGKIIKKEKGKLKGENVFIDYF